MSLNLKSKLDYRLQPDLEREFQEQAMEWNTKTLRVGIPLVAVLGLLFYFSYRFTSMATHAWNFILASEIVLVAGFFSLSLKGKARHLLNYLTPVFPVLYVFGLMTLHIPKIPDISSMNQAQNWILWIVFLLYSLERISPVFAILNSFSTTAIFLWLRRHLPAGAQVNDFQVGWQMLATHGAGILICFDHCRNARRQFKFKRELEAQRRQSEELLQNVLPEAIVKELKTNATTIAHSYENVTVLFADLVGFTKRSTMMEPRQLVHLLNELFSRFDSLASRCGVEKVKTIGDAYMAVTGCPAADPQHALRMIQFAIQLGDVVDQFNKDFSLDFSIKIGLSSGPVMGGVIGTKRISFDIWGDVVNLASRIESVSSGGVIAVSETTAELLSEKIKFSGPRMVDLKGKGPTPIYLVSKEQPKGAIASSDSKIRQVLDGQNDLAA